MTWHKVSPGSTSGIFIKDYSYVPKYPLNSTDARVAIYGTQGLMAKLEVPKSSPRGKRIE